MVFKSGPNILIPIGLRIPVESMSIRFFIGIVQMFGIPMKLSFSFISSTSFSSVIVSGQILWNGLLVNSGRKEYQRRSFLHSDFGLRTIVVSNMLRGAVSVDVSALPAFPKTVSTSGNDFII